MSKSGVYKVRQYIQAKGQRSGTLEVIGETFYAWCGGKRRPHCVVRCDCGEVFPTLFYNLKENSTCKKCASALSSIRNADHGLSKEPLFNRYKAMIHRCHNPRMKSYRNYGARGIQVCEEWRNDYLVFRKWAFENGYRQDLDIDRKDNNGNYEPGNCRFVLRRVNCRNKRGNRLLTAFGETKTVAEWTEDPRCTVARGALESRICRGWGHEEAISSPSRIHGPKFRQKE